MVIHSMPADSEPGSPRISGSTPGDKHPGPKTGAGRMLPGVVLAKYQQVGISIFLGENKPCTVKTVGPYFLLVW
jgi:hypothetical protein